MVEKILIIYCIILNLAGYISMGIDKDRARKNRWRIRERSLFLISILGGSFGSLLGMILFHHKTKHIKFILGIPVILLLQIIILVYILSYCFGML
jgi:uncharacterized membrane protein YsdA (DUF1294 family)